MNELIDRVVREVKDTLDIELSDKELKELAENVIVGLLAKGYTKDEDIVFLAVADIIGILKERLKWWKLEKLVEEEL